MADVIVFVRGREATYVYGARDELIVYWDNLDEGMCPVCEDILDADGKYCYCGSCKFRWRGATADRVVEHFGDT